MNVCKTQIDITGNPDFKLRCLLEADLVTNQDLIEEVTDGADKQ